MSIIRKEQLTNPLSASYALTASYALSANVTFNTSSLVTTSSFNTFTASINQFTSSYNTGSFSGSFIGSFNGTASWAESASQAISSSYVLTASYALNIPIIDLSGYVTTSSFNNFTSSYNTGSFSGSFIGSLQGTASWAESASQALTASYYHETDPIFTAVSGTFVTTSSFNNFTSSINTFTSSYNTGSFTGSFSGSFYGTSSWAEYSRTSSYYQETDPIFVSKSASLATTRSNNFTSDQIITGSLIITKDLTILGSQSVQYITSSQLDISTNLITVNTSTPAVRFGGLAVRDSGSLATGLTGSILWDSQNNVWIYSNPSGSTYDGGLLLTGPRNTSGLGNEEGINSWYAALGNGSHHMTSSQIYNSGSLIRLETNTQVTGSLNISAGITGSLFGNATTAATADTLSSFADVDKINTGDPSDVFIRPNELEQSKYATLNIYNYTNFT